jgi:hypothetical protein
MNRAQRREMAKRLKARDVVVLRGGPMDGWTVKASAPALQPDWRAGYLEAVAERLERLHRKDQPKSTVAWADLDADVRDAYRRAARELEGDGRYEVRSGEALAVWREL